MAKKGKVFEYNEDTGRVSEATYKKTRALAKSERANLIPLTPAPQTRWEKFKRAAVG